jgi:hypothetical protein
MHQLTGPRVKLSKTELVQRAAALHDSIRMKHHLYAASGSVRAHGYCLTSTCLQCAPGSMAPPPHARACPARSATQRTPSLTQNARGSS